MIIFPTDEDNIYTTHQMKVAVAIKGKWDLKQFKFNV
jgi:hypothetical protein